MSFAKIEIGQLPSRLVNWTISGAPLSCSITSLVASSCEDRRRMNSLCKQMPHTPSLQLNLSTNSPHMRSLSTVSFAMRVSPEHIPLSPLDRPLDSRHYLHGILKSSTVPPSTFVSSSILPPLSSTASQNTAGTPLNPSPILDNSSLLILLLLNLVQLPPIRLAWCN